MKLTDSEWNEVKKFALASLNHKVGEDLMDADYFVDHEVEADATWYGLYRHLLIEMRADDDGGPSMMYLVCSTDPFLETVYHATWWFDGDGWIMGDWRPAFRPEGR